MHTTACRNAAKVSKFQSHLIQYALRSISAILICFCLDTSIYVLLMQENKNKKLLVLEASVPPSEIICA